MEMLNNILPNSTPYLCDFYHHILHEEDTIKIKGLLCRSMQTLTTTLTAQSQTVNENNTVGNQSVNYMHRSDAEKVSSL